MFYNNGGEIQKKRDLCVLSVGVVAGVREKIRKNVWDVHEKNGGMKIISRDVCLVLLFLGRWEWENPHWHFPRENASALQDTYFPFNAPSFSLSQFFSFSFQIHPFFIHGK